MPLQVLQAAITQIGDEICLGAPVDNIVSFLLTEDDLVGFVILVMPLLCQNHFARFLIGKVTVRKLNDTTQLRPLEQL